MVSRFWTAALMALVVTVGAERAVSQSQNVPVIVNRLLESVCVPYVRTGDMVGAVRAAEALGYRQVDGRSHLLLDRSVPSGQVLLVRSQGGGVMLGQAYHIGHCVIGVEEGTVAAVADAADTHLEALRLSRILDETGRNNAHTDVVVWMDTNPAADVQASAIRGANFSPGAELALIFSVDPHGR
ncbi:MAG: hypothetical protein ACI8U3_002666 [Brevundimonas sp.]|jgi:hypothetical protein|uniref:hypothetical protein n=1 Tax=Brevundimonas sp. TaxID=1871086 RepID=UPI0039E4CAE2